MPGCKSCQQRRRLLAAGYAKGGIKGAVKAVPSIGRHLVAHPPKLKGKDDGANR
jgi:hypothetical protein